MKEQMNNNDLGGEKMKTVTDLENLSQEEKDNKFIEAMAEKDAIAIILSRNEAKKIFGSQEKCMERHKEKSDEVDELLKHINYDSKISEKIAIRREEIINELRDKQ